MEKKEITVISRIIQLSKIILSLKLNKRYLIKSKEISSRTDIRLTTREFYYSMIEEIESRQREVNNQIKNLLLPLFQDHNFGYIEWNQWALSQREMQQGFIRLELERYRNLLGKYVGNPIYYILFLSDYQDKVYNIKEGSLYLESNVSPILLNQKDVFGNYIDINRYLNSDICPRYKTCSISTKIQIKI
jgi:hypothetical protein